jgi:hypothetical protein
MTDGSRQIRIATNSRAAKKELIQIQSVFRWFGSKFASIENARRDIGDSVLLGSHHEKTSLRGQLGLKFIATVALFVLIVCVVGAGIFAAGRSEWCGLAR